TSSAWKGPCLESDSDGTARLVSASDSRRSCSRELICTDSQSTASMMMRGSGYTERASRRNFSAQRKDVIRREDRGAQISWRGAGAGVGGGKGLHPAVDREPTDRDAGKRHGASFVSRERESFIDPLPDGAALRTAHAGGREMGVSLDKFLLRGGRQRERRHVRRWCRPPTAANRSEVAGFRARCTGRSADERSSKGAVVGEFLAGSSPSDVAD
ncbi:unnamed protein product, partial [Lampetra planeri]